jgi:flagellin
MTAKEQASAFASITAGSQYTAGTPLAIGGSSNTYTLAGTAAFTTSSVTGAGSTSLVFTSAASNNTALLAGAGGWTNTTAGNGVITASDNDVAGTTLSGAAGAIANITAAVGKLGTISASLGSASQEITGMQSFSSTLSDALTAGVGALTDADLATESAKLTSLQTKQQLAIQALSIANQGPQSLLSLFK